MHTNIKLIYIRGKVEILSNATIAGCDMHDQHTDNLKDNVY